MLTKEIIEKPRTPSALCDFISSVKAEVERNASERPAAHLKRGLYKQFVDELIPLSVFCKEHYRDDVRVQLLCGSQPFDAVVKDINGREIEKMEEVRGTT